MRTTVELPDEVLKRAKSEAALTHISLRQFFLEAIEARLRTRPAKPRKNPPTVGKEQGPKINLLTREQIDEAMFG